MKDIFKIAVDGYSSCGKSTIARQLAEKLDAVYIDSGAMYRAVTLFAIENKCIADDKFEIDCLRNKIDDIKLTFNSENNHIRLNGRDVEDEIRKSYVAKWVSEIATVDFVRSKMVALQQSYCSEYSVVMDGRDIGTHVFPDAQAKLFLTADKRIRAKRRYDELISKGIQTSIDEVLENIEKRDYIDQHRDIAPLRKANDAVEIDNSKLNREEQLELALKIVKSLIYK